MEYLQTKEELDYLRKAKKGDKEAIEKIIKNNIRLIYCLVNKQNHDQNKTEDLVSEGVIGLIEAINKYNYKQGKFSTYAYSWIEKYIKQYMRENMSLVVFPQYINLLMKDFLKAKIFLHGKLKREPMICEIAEYMHISKKDATKIELHMIPLIENIPLEDIENTVLYKNEDGDTEIDFENFCGENNILLKLMEALSKKEKKIFELRYGLLTGEVQTIHRIAKKMNMTSSSVFQIEKEILRKLRKKAYKLLNKKLKLVKRNVV